MKILGKVALWLLVNAGPQLVSSAIDRLSRKQQRDDRRGQAVDGSAGDDRQLERK